jgi:hypothetical protein
MRDSPLRFPRGSVPVHRVRPIGHGRMS